MTAKTVGNPCAEGAYPGGAAGAAAYPFAPAPKAATLEAVPSAIHRIAYART